MQAAIVVDPGGEIGAGETGGVKLVRVRLVVLFGNGVVDGQGVGLGGPADCDANHCFGLEIGAVFVAVRVLVEVDAREEGEPRARVWGSPVNEFERVLDTLQVAMHPNVGPDTGGTRIIMVPVIGY